MNSSYCALLRGINVGKAKRIAMADLRAVVAGLGYTDGQTLLNSGNVVFRAPAGTVPAEAAAQIQAGIAARIGVVARVTVLTAAELAAIIAENPFGLDVAPDPSRLLVSVANTPADLAKLGPLAQQAWGADRLAIGRRAAYIWCSEGILASKLAEAAGKLLRDAATARNWATMLKLGALAGQ